MSQALQFTPQKNALYSTQQPGCFVQIHGLVEHATNQYLIDYEILKTEYSNKNRGLLIGRYIYLIVWFDSLLLFATEENYTHCLIRKIGD